MVSAYIRIVALFLLSSLAVAANQNQVPSCYKANPKVGLPAPEPLNHLVLIFDETTLLDEPLTQSLVDIVQTNLVAGTAFTILRFSAISQGRYTDIVVHGEIESPILKQKRNSISVPALKTFDACMKGQAVFARDMALNAIASALQRSTSDLRNSDVIASLSDASKVMRESRASKKIVLIVSDMIEHSSITTFYSNSALRKIDPVKEFKAVEAASAMGDFGGAAVYVLGGGLLPVGQVPKGTKKNDSGYRPSQNMAALEAFWNQYFKRSNGILMEFGKPALLTSIKW